MGLDGHSIGLITYGSDNGSPLQTRRFDEKLVGKVVDEYIGPGLTRHSCCGWDRGLKKCLDASGGGRELESWAWGCRERHEVTLVVVDIYYCQDVTKSQ